MCEQKEVIVWSGQLKDWVLSWFAEAQPHFWIWFREGIWSWPTAFYSLFVDLSPSYQAISLFVYLVFSLSMAYNHRTRLRNPLLRFLELFFIVVFGMVLVSAAMWLSFALMAILLFYSLWISFGLMVLVLALCLAIYEIPIRWIGSFFVR